MTRPATFLTLIIPVYNGAAALPETLAALGRQVRPGMRVVIVANGCRDESAKVARELAGSHLSHAEVEVLDLAQGSRPGALNAGDERAEGTRVMLDQDAVLGDGCLAAIERAIAEGAHFVTARLLWGHTGSWLVRSALSAWSELPYVVRSPVSAGLYAFSATCRQRFDAFPADLPDDKLVRLLCRPHERVRLAGVHYRVSPPGDFRGLVAARRRYAVSNQRLGSQRPALFVGETRKTDGLAGLITRPGLWPGLASLTVAEALARMRA